MKTRTNTTLPLCVSLLTLFTATVLPARAEDMTVAKDTIKLTVTKYSCFMHDEGCKGSDAVLYPEIKCHLNGALPSGATPWVEFRLAGKPPLRMDCAVDDVFGFNDLRWEITGGSHQRSETGFVFAGGKVPAGSMEFSIGLRNDLAETNAILYEGKFQYDKVLINPGDESTSELFVNDDWRLPIGYLYMTDRGLRIVTWYRGRPGGVKTYLFYNGKEVANNEGCGIGDVSNFDPTMRIWWEVDCELIGVYGDAETAKNGYEPNYDLSANPGDYEIKALAGGKLARVIKFTVKPDGSFDNGIAAANQLGSDPVIVHVEIRMDNPVWNKTAWKTGAYYGHPLTGFVGPE